MQIDINNSKAGKIDVEISFFVPYDGSWTYTFSHLCSRIEAAFVRDAIQTQFESVITNIRKDAYEAGYKAGRGKQAKRNDFHECFNYLARNTR